MSFTNRTDEASIPLIVAHLSPSSISSTEHEETTIIHPQAMYWYPINIFIFFYCLWVIASLLNKFILPSRLFLGQRWVRCDKHRRTMIVYLLSLVVTFIALVLQLAACGIFSLHITLQKVNLMRTAAALVSTLYFFELIYREQMRFAMICHHTLTVFAISFVIILLDKTHDPSFILTGSLWLFQATTEQLTFVALFGYRLEWQPRVLRPLLQIAAVQSFIVKMASIAAFIYIWFKYQKDEVIFASYNHGWDAVVWLAALGLMATQVWGSWVVWTMSTSLEARYEKKRIEQNQQHSELIQKLQSSNDLEKQQMTNTIDNLLLTTILPRQDYPASTGSIYHTNDSSAVQSKEAIQGPSN